MGGFDSAAEPAVGSSWATRIARSGRYSVITRDDVRSMLEHEQLKMEVGCEEEAP